jgi:hypothetical protein
MKDLIARLWTNDESLTSLDLSTRDDDTSFCSNSKSTTPNATTTKMTSMIPNHHTAELLQAAACKNTRLSHLRLYSSHVDSVRGPGRFVRHLEMIQHLQGLRDLQIHAYCVPPLAFPTRQLAGVIHRKQQPAPLSSAPDKQQQQRQHTSLQRLALHQVRMDPHDRTGQILLAQAFASLQQDQESSSSSTSTLQDLEWDPFPFSAAAANMANHDVNHNTDDADAGMLVVANIAKLPLKRLSLTGCGGTKTTIASMKRLGLSSATFAPMFRIKEHHPHLRHRHHHHLQSLQLSSWILDNADCIVLAQFLQKTSDLTELDLSGCIFYWTNNNNNNNSSEEPKLHASIEKDDSPMAIMKSFETNASVQYLNLTDCQFQLVVPVDNDNNHTNHSSINTSSCASLARMEERVYTTLTRAVESHNYTLSWVKTCPLLRQRANEEWSNVHAVGRSSSSSSNKNKSNSIINNSTGDDCCETRRRTSVMDVLDNLLILNRSALLLSTPGNFDGSASSPLLLPSCIRKSLTGQPRQTWCHVLQRTAKSPTALYAMLRGNADQLFFCSTFI